MATCLWKHEEVDIPQVISIFDTKEVIKTSTGYWSKSDQYIVPIRELEEMIGWDSYLAGPLMWAMPVTHVIWEEDNKNIVLYQAQEGCIDGDLKEIRKFSSVEEAEEFVKSSGF